METSWLIERLDNPALLQKGDEQRLRELIATYPYFSAPYLLLARSLHEQNHPAFEQLLPLISLQAFDRKRLFRLIHEETMDHRPSTIAEEEREAVPAAGAESEAEVKVEEMRGLGDEEEKRRRDLETGRLGDEGNDMVRHLTEEPVLSLPKESTTDEPETPVEEMRRLGDEEQERQGDEGNDMVRHAERSRSTTDEPESSEIEEPSSHVERPGHRFAVNFNEIEKTTEEPAQTVHDELQEIPFLLTMDHGPWTIAEEEREAVPAAGVESEVEEKKEVENVGTEHFLPEPIPETHNPEPITRNPTTDRIDFIHWLEKLQPVKKAEEMRGSGDEENEMVRHLREEPVLSLSKESTTDLTEDHNQEPKIQNPEPGTHNPDFLIDKFIETNPSVSRVKERFYDPAVQARESERLDDNLMTETLARIFVKQEKYERAIDAYRKLQLKYPEKSDYFAALILEINSKIN